MKDSGTEKGNQTRDMILEFIKSHSKDKGYPPSIRDIMHGTRLSSTSAVVYQLNQLERRGRITRNRLVARSILVTPMLPVQESPRAIPPDVEHIKGL